MCVAGSERECICVGGSEERKEYVCMWWEGREREREGNEGKNEREGERKECVFTSSAVLVFSGSHLLRPNED